MIAALITVAACAVLNRLRGDDRWMPAWLPGRSLFYVAPAIGAVALAAQPWPIALAFAAAYLFWAVWSWGYPLGALGGHTPNRQPDGLERLLMRLGTPWAALARMAFALPGLALVAWLSAEPLYLVAGVALGPVATLIYLAFLDDLGKFDWLRAEVAVGALWGALIAA